MIGYITSDSLFLKVILEIFFCYSFLQTSCGGMSITEVRRSTLVYFSMHGKTKNMPRVKMHSLNYEQSYSFDQLILIIMRYNLKTGTFLCLTFVFVC